MNFVFASLILFFLTTILLIPVNGLRLTQRNSQGISTRNTFERPHQSLHISHKLHDSPIKQYRYKTRVIVKRRSKRRMFISIIEQIAMLPLLPIFLLGIIGVNGILYFFQTIYILFFDEYS